MTKKVFGDEEMENKMEPISLSNELKVKQIVRKIGANPDGIVTYAETVDSELSSWINSGWKLSFVVRIATESDGHTILYVLTKD